MVVRSDNKRDILFLTWAEKHAAGVVRFLEQHILLALTLALVLGLLLRLYLTDLGAIENIFSDALVYLLKSLEIVQGNWTPILTHAYGISIVAAPFFWLLGPATLLEQVVHAHVFAVLLGTAVLIPTWLLAREFLSRAGQLAVVVLVAANPEMLAYSQLFLSDTLFAVVATSCLWLCVKGRTDVRYLYAAALVAGCAYWVRPNGFVVLAAVLLLAAFYHYQTPRRMLGLLAALVGIWMIVVTPMLTAREAAFGSMFFYGENSKVFVDNYKAEVWAPNVPVPGLTEYLVTHSPLEWVEKFGIKGAVNVAFSAVHGWGPLRFSGIIPPVLLLFVLLGLWIAVREKRFVPPLVFLLLLGGILSLSYSIHATPRYLLFAVPILYVLAWVAIAYLGKNVRYKTLAGLLVVVVVVGYSLISPVLASVQRPSPEYTPPEWSSWVAEHVQGVLVAAGHTEYVILQLPDSRVAGSGMHELYAPETGLRMARYGQFDTFEEAVKWHTSEQGATHFLVNKTSLDARPFLREVDPDNLPSGVVQVYEYRGGEREYAVVYAVVRSEFASTTNRSPVQVYE